jgi:DNA primase
MNVTDNIRALANQYLQQVKPSGPENIMAICPFHVKADGTPEKHPSFAMSTVNGLWFCHSCQSKGNLFTFLRDFGLDRSQIDLQYSMIIDAANKNMPQAFDPAHPNVFSDNPIPEGLLGVFDYCPTALLEEGFTEETLRRFDIGFDMTRYRITFPIRDLTSRLVAVSGRSVIGSHPKYKIYDKEYKDWDLPIRPNWDKRTALWNANDIYTKVYFQTIPDFVVVVEGFKACMWLWQAGIKNVVALIGTYLSNEQRWILERMGAPIYLFLDNNFPGQRGIGKFGEKLRRSLRMFIVDYPERLWDDEDAQPDSLTVDEVHEQINGAKSYFDWLAH